MTQYTLCQKERHHKNCFQWGFVVYCHDCKEKVATSYVQAYFKKPFWLSEQQIKENDEIAKNE